jgi:hypothetical protein
MVEKTLPYQINIIEYSERIKMLAHNGGESCMAAPFERVSDPIFVKEFETNLENFLED